MATSFKWLLRALLAVCVAYVTLFAVVLSAMLSSPDRFGSFMKHMPPALVWGALPARPMWLWARGLAVGDLAPDFELPRQSESSRVRLYVIDSNGAIAYTSAAGPFGFEPSDVELTLRQLLGN